ncbi:sulfate anion transporter 1-like isoform X2 [Pollicipes pollicipes]|uniref:sulfate anion transporter 1-like isoform X2 n=1 Tax=Pollicipes pollicipes TaxID=41117 RepID=UPI0018852049|nr:sulfate anion transporter 1-like isoform X2 [Pollicipes pollicipes]
MPEPSAAGGAGRGLTLSQFRHHYLYSPQPPQGMAYALLAGVPPIHGIYMAFFQCLLYVVLGTSRHLSVGTFAVTCIMTGKVVLEYSAPQPGAPGRPEHDPVTVATTVALAVGLVQLAMFVLRMAALTVVLSDMLVRGFTTGAAVHVLFSQLPSLFGLHLPRFSGAGKLAKLSVAILKNVHSANPASTAISAATIVILVLNNELFKPQLAKRTRFPVPVELLVVIVGTSVSFFCDLAGRFDVQVTGNVTTGLPRPSSPAISLLPNVLLDAVIIAIITYSVALSMAQLLARKHEYTVDASQELLAQGVGNAVSAWFSCAPMGASLSRSLIVDATGGRTQASGLITALLLLFVLLWLGPVFQLLPRCVLSAIIVVSLKGLLCQLREAPQLWRTSRADTLIWAATLLAVVLVDIDVGLAVGVVVSVVVLLWRHQRPPAELLGRVPGTDLYMDRKKYRATELDPDVRIFRFGGALHFCNVGYFRSRLAALTGLEEARRRQAASREDCESAGRRRRAANTADDMELLAPLTAEDSDGGGRRVPATPRPAGFSPFSHLVLDMSGVSFTDSASTRDLLAVVRECQALGISCLLAGCNETVLRMLHACRSPLQEDQLYPSVHDAVVAIRSSHVSGDAQWLSDSAS